MKISKIHKQFIKWAGTAALAAVLAVGMMSAGLTAYAESAGEVTAATAKIRKEPSTDSETLASTASGNAISITGQTTGNDGYTWYQVWVDDSTLGYIRSDLVTITDGSTPAAVDSTATANTDTTTTTTDTATTTTDTGTTGTDETVVAVTAVNPVNGSVSGSTPVRVRQNASTTSSIYTTVESGNTFSVIGTATGTDGNQWYQVSLTSAGTEITGFIRADYVTVDGELTAATETTDTGTEETTATEEPVQETTSKDWDTYQDEDGLWHLQDNTSGEVYSITGIFDTVDTNAKLANEATAAQKTLKTVAIILAILLAGAVGAAGYLFYRMKEMADSAYYNDVAQETLRDRQQARGQNRRPASSGQQRAPGGQRSASGQQRRERTAGPEKTAAAKPQAESQAKAPANSQAKAPADNQAKAPAEIKAKATAESQTKAPAEKQAKSPAEKTAKAPADKQTKASVNQQADKQSGQASKQGWKTKNFIADDDEFEFEFLDWDGKDE